VREVNYTFKNEEVQLLTTSFEEWQKEACILNYGVILICESGNSSITVNFKTYQLTFHSVLILFPNDVVLLTTTSADFTVRALCYTPAMLREASLQIESTVYDSLRKDRCQTDSPVPCKLIQLMFATLSLYFTQDDCTCLSQLVLLQLKGYFLGYYDYLVRHPNTNDDDTVSPRTRELFQRFNMLIDRNYKKSRDVAFYASLLNITPKHLNSISHKCARLSSKVIIDHYTVLQIKLLLRNSQASIKEIAWEYNFANFSFFCRYFKKHTGITPQQYRKLN